MPPNFASESLPRGARRPVSLHLAPNGSDPESTPRRFRRPIPWLLLCLAALVFPRLLPASPLELHERRSSPTDLEVTGRLTGIPPGGKRFIRWADLRNLPTKELELTGEFLPGKQNVTVVFLDELWRHLPCDRTADTLLATCGDGYAAVFTQSFIDRYRPFLVLEINGVPPERWPPPGLKFDPGPYVVTVSSELAPAAAAFLDIEHKKPWGVTTLEVAAFADRFHGFHTGRWLSLSPRASQGREIWVNSCASCHQGPAGTFGGTKSDQPFPVLEALASCQPDFFRHYVRDPKSENPNAAMEPHPHYSDTQLDALIAFLKAEPASP